MTLAEKIELISELNQKLQAELDAATLAQKTTAAGATHEESRAENDKDTRALESTYLARGQAERVRVLREELELLDRLQLRAFNEDAPVALGAWLTIASAEGEKSLLLAPAGAGTKLGKEQSVTVITPRSPLGRALLGKFLYDLVEIESPESRREVEIVALS